MELTLNKLFGLYYSTEELLRDATALGSIVEEAFTAEMAFKLDDALIRGDGAGKPLGVLDAAMLAKVEVAKESGQAADTLVFANIVKMYSRMWAHSRANAVWFINQDVEPQLFQLSLAVGTGGAPAYLPANGLSEAPYATLMGKPVIPIEQCDTIGDAGDIILADFSQYLLIDKGGITGDSSIHVRFVNDETTFKWTMRCDAQSTWAQPLTPYQSSNTLAPFVTLAERA